MNQISWEEFENWRNNHQTYHLVDVREPEEHQAFNIGGSLIPLGEIIRHKEEIPTHLPVVFYCRKGIRSQIAIQRLEAAGVNGLFFNLTGGIYHLSKSS